MTPGVLPFGKVLITGGHGFVGRYLARAISDRLPAGGRLVRSLHRGIETAAAEGESVSLDLSDRASVFAAVADVRPDLVVHLAGQASVGEGSGRAAETWSLNAVGSLILAQAIAASAPHATVVFASSAEAYGLTFNFEVAGEQSPLRPISVYARSKVAAENALSDVLPPSARLIIARPCNHSGPGQAESYVIPAFATQLARVELGQANAVRVGNLDPQRDFLDVRDVVAAYVALLAASPILPGRSIFNIGSASPVSIGEVLARLLAMSTHHVRVEQDPARMRPAEVLRAALDVSAIREATGWAPEHGLDELLGSVLAEARARVAG